jgi:hypothetical protein
LAALQHEVAHVRELLARSEDQELDYLIEVEPLEEIVNAVKAKAQPQVARRSELQATIAELQAGLDDELASLQVGRSERAALLSPELLARYDAAFSRVGTSGAAQVDAGTLRWLSHRAVAARRRSLEGAGGGFLHALSRVRPPLVAVIILIRHGQTTTNAQRLLVGRSDPALTELGERQAISLRPLLTRVGEVWTSPLQRARATAALAIPRHRRGREGVVH